MLWVLTLDGRVYLASYFNAAFLGIQLWHVWRTRTVSGLSLGMFIGFFLMQLTFMQLGFKTRQWGLFGGMLCSAVITALTIVLIVAWS